MMMNIVIHVETRRTHRKNKQECLTRLIDNVKNTCQQLLFYILWCCRRISTKTDYALSIMNYALNKPHILRQLPS